MSIRRSYLGQVKQSLRTAWKGLRLTLKHYRSGNKPQQPLGINNPGYFTQAPGPITIQYPAVKVPVPDVGRYRLHMETDDCIGCDKCARICPVDCITIETFRADGDLGKTSDGTLKRLHLPVFDIDMGKCMFCGLCTTVCPTECLTMTKVYDFSEYDRDNLVYHFGAYSPEQEQLIRTETEASLEKKKLEKAAIQPAVEASTRPRPMVKRAESVPSPESPAEEVPQTSEEPKTFRPRPMIKRVAVSTEPEESVEPVPASEDQPEQPKPRPRPVMKRPATESNENQETQPEESETPPVSKPRPRPVMKRPEPEQPEEADPVEPAQEEPKPESGTPKTARPRPVFKRPNQEPPQES